VDEVRTREYAEALLKVSFDRFDRFSDTLPLPLGNLLDGVRTRWLGCTPGSEPVTSFFLGAGGTPAFQLLAWLAESIDPAPQNWDGLVEAAGEGMLCLYFSVRCQDDRVDEAANPKLTYLEGALTARAVQLLVGVAGDASAMLAEWESFTRKFGEAAHRDAELRSADHSIWDDEAIALQGHKYLPMALPLAALLLGAGRSSALPAMYQTVERLGVGLQLTNDIYGVHRDLATRQGSPFLADLDLEPGRSAPYNLYPSIRRSLRNGKFQRTFELAADALRSGLEPLAGFSSPRLAQHVEQRVLELEANHRRMSMAALFQVPELMADIEITRRCNLRCPACFVFAQEEDDRNDKLPELPTATLLALVDELSGYQTHLHLTGGEAFLHRGIWDMLEHAAKRGMPEVIINTNGSLLNEQRLARLAALPLRVRLLVSIDGPPGVQETARAPGMTKKALDAIRNATRLGIIAEPCSILTSELVDYGVDRWFDYLTGELGRAPALTLWPIFLYPDTKLSLDQGGSVLDGAHLWAAARQVAKLMLASFQVTVADYPVINPLLARLGVPAEQLWQCNAGRGRISVQADGLLSPCHPFRLDLGQVTETSVRGFVDRILQHTDYQRLGHREHEGCVTCPEQAICGNCQAAVVGKGHALGANDHFCDTVIGPLAERHLATGPATGPATGQPKRQLVRLPLLQSTIHANPD
jgi:radical SAM protein with 4Fe4S-binding SPASM domain